MTLAGSQPNDPVLANLYLYGHVPMEHGPQHLWGNQRLSVNDCFLRNMHKYKYIANIDDDEIIMPQNATSWLEMMEVVEKLSQNEVGILTGLTSLGSSNFESKYTMFPPSHKQSRAKPLYALCILYFSDCWMLEVSKCFIFGYYANNRK